jgi:hypothetical protein
LFGNKKQQEKHPLPPTTSISSNSIQQTPTNNTKTFDFITSKFFSLKSIKSKIDNSSQFVNSQNINKSKTQPIIEKQPSLYSSSSSSSTSLNNNNYNIIDQDTTSIKTNNSSNNLVIISELELQVPASQLIFENRPSNLPAKSQQEELKHRQEYEKMIEQAKRKEQKEKEAKLKKYQQQVKKEEFMTNSLRVWNNEILPNWNEQ